MLSVRLRLDRSGLCLELDRYQLLKRARCSCISLHLCDYHVHICTSEMEQGGNEFDLNRLNRGVKTASR